MGQGIIRRAVQSPLDQVVRGAMGKGGRKNPYKRLSPIKQTKNLSPDYVVGGC